MACVAGVDGCAAGWLAIIVQYEDAVLSEEAHLCSAFRDVLSLLSRPSIVAVDIPIGLLAEVREGGRECDRLLRQLFGRPRSSSVFSPPVRPALASADFEEARRWRLNKQSFGILPRVREMDEVMTPSLQKYVREVHPELCFYTLNNLAAARESKKKVAGLQERKDLLSRYFFEIDRCLGRFGSKDAGADDILDAYAAAWTALRILRGEAGRIPDEPPVDAKGLRMEIWY